jgi:hypothetical protein
MSSVLKDLKKNNRTTHHVDAPKVIEFITKFGIGPSELLMTPPKNAPRKDVPIHVKPSN